MVAPLKRAETLQVYTVLGYFSPRDALPKVTLQTLSKAADLSPDRLRLVV